MSSNLKISFLFIPFLIIFTSTPSTAQDSLNVEILSQIDFWGSVTGVFLEGDLCYLGAGTAGLKIMDVSNPSQAEEIGYCFIPSEIYNNNPFYLPVYRLTLDSIYIYMAANLLGTRIIDVSNPAHPEEIGYHLGASDDIVVYQDYAYACNSSGLFVLDISDPTNPEVVGTCNTQWPKALARKDSFLYVVGIFAGLQIVDISDPTAPDIVNTYMPEEHFYDIIISGDLAYLGSPNSGFYILDVSNPEYPVQIGFTSDIGNCREMVLSGNYVYYSMGIHGFGIIRVTNLTSPSSVGVFDIEGDIRSLDISDTLLYLSDLNSGIRVFDISDPYIPVEHTSFGEIYYINQTVVADQYTYLAGEGLRVFDVLDPTAPLEVNYCDAFSHLTCLVVSGDVMYALGGGGYPDLYIIDLTDPSAPSALGLWELGWPGVGTAVGMCDGYVYSLFPILNLYSGYYEVSRLYAIDVSDPSAPFDIAEYVIDSWGRGVNMMIFDNHAFFIHDGGTLRIIDLTDPFNMIQVGISWIPENPLGIAISGNYAYIADGTEGLLVMDVSDLSAPVEIGRYYTPGIAKDVTVVDDHVFVADGCYGGMRVFWIIDPYNLVETGYYDTEGDCIDIFPENGLLYVSNGHFFSIYDCSDAIPVMLSHESTPCTFSFSPPYPNPFNPTTTIRFDLPIASLVNLEVFDINGRRVGVGLAPTRHYPPGHHQITFDGSDLSSGIYIYRLTAGTFNATGKMVMMK